MARSNHKGLISMPTHAQAVQTRLQTYMKMGSVLSDWMERWPFRFCMLMYALNMGQLTFLSIPAALSLHYLARHEALE
jgi:hypothetical protein